MPIKDTLFCASDPLESRIDDYLSSLHLHPVNVVEYFRDTRVYQESGNGVIPHGGPLRLPPKKSLCGKLRKMYHKASTLQDVFEETGEHSPE
jgi:hypothetical protein